MADDEGNCVAIIGAGLFGLVTAKVLLHEANKSFSSVTIFEKGSSIGGVWSKERIYPGLASNSPALTYEIPGFPYRESLRRCGAHVEANDINAYLHAFAQSYDLVKHVKLNSEIRVVKWNRDRQRWCIRGSNENGKFEAFFKYLVICNGLYHEKSVPPSLNLANSSSAPRIFHSADMGNPHIRKELSASSNTVIVGAGKSAIDLATIIARGDWAVDRQSKPAVTLIYRRPHWLSPRAILGGVVNFERILFSRFLNAWLPFAWDPDALHSWIAGSLMGRWLTRKIFYIVEGDFKSTLRQKNVPETVPSHPLREALSGALHVVPEGYLDLVRTKQIGIIQGSLQGVSDARATIRSTDGKFTKLKVDKILCATGYKIAFPFFSGAAIEQLGLCSSQGHCDPNDLSRLNLHRLIVPPFTVHHRSDSGEPHRNIAFNGFAYSLLNPTVSYVSAHWIADYFLGRINLPGASQIKSDVDLFYNWQMKTFGKHGKKGVHIGPHATLYADLLLSDMDVKTGHVDGWQTNPVKMIREWLRPMYPQIYRNLAEDKRQRDKVVQVESSKTRKPYVWQNLWYNLHVVLFSSLCWIIFAEIISQMLSRY